MNDVTKALKEAEVTTVHRLPESGLSKNKLKSQSVPTSNQTQI